MEEKRFRAFHIVLYLEDESQIKALEYIKDNFNYASIIHDRDFNEDGTKKKTHVHVIVRFVNGRTLSALANELNIKSNYIEPCKKDYKKALLYLIHYGEDKVPYFVDEVEGDLKKVLVKTLQGFELEDDNVLEIIKLLESCERITLIEFIKLLCNKGLYSNFRRSQYTFIKLLQEHNENY